ncbi:pyruvate kinase [Lysinibacillus sp. FSL M8-0134]|uniref:pyruvate kinase n=1 Tax=Lysinibacillus sp. FSL M8-0134 TaxID=2921717 RepID=UPI00311A813F
MRKPKILASMGPHLFSPEDILHAFELGVKNYRVNLGKRHRNNLQYISNVFKAKEKRSDIILMIDLPSSRPRISNNFKDSFLEVGQEVLIYDSCISCNNLIKTCIPLYNLDECFEYIEVGDIINFDDGKVKVRIESINISKKTLKAICIKSMSPIVKSTSIIINNKSISYTLLTKEDRQFLLRLKKYQLVPDWISISFVENGIDIKTLKKEINNIFGENEIKIISKIETQNSLNNINDIIKCSNGIMVARGDLCQNIDPAMIPTVQQSLVKLANEKQVISIVATQILEKFAITGEVCFSELSDISLAVQQRTDFLMLSGESGAKRSKECLKLMTEVIHEEFINRGYNSL